MHVSYSSNLLFFLYFRQYWCDYFTNEGVRVFFWSAKLETERQETLETEDTASEGEDAATDDSAEDQEAELETTDEAALV